MRVAELWRYPVKSMAGERLAAADVTELGIRGDRVVHVRSGKGSMVTSRTRPRLLRHRAVLGPDGRRLRPNIVISGVEGLAERTWEGKFLRAGEVIIGIQDLRGRCIMTTFDPDTLVQDVGVLRRIQQEFGGTMALNCYVVCGGTLRVGDPVEIVETAD